MIGSTSVSAITHVNVQGPVYRLDDVAIATGSVDLWDGSIAAPIVLNEFGISSGTTNVWTGTFSNGTRIPGNSLGLTAAGRRRLLH